jgi:diguanylate cyclase (GGDEF)-like protein/PAS domain S-box-containing protein
MENLEKQHVEFVPPDYPLNVTSLDEIIPILAAIFQDSLDCVAVYSQSGQLVYANTTLKKVLGPKLYKAKADFNIELEEFKPYLAVLAGVLATGAPASILVDCEHPDLQRSIHDIVYMTAIKTNLQQVQGVIAVGHDLNFYKIQHSQELVQREHYQRAVLDNFPFMVWLKDNNSRFLATNQVFADLVGCASPNDLVGKTDYDFFSKAAADGYVADDKEVLATGLPKAIAESITNQFGQAHWAEVYKSPLVIEGSVIGTVGFARDLADTIKLQAQVLQKQSEYSLLVESLPLTIIRYDLECRRIYVNKFCEKIAGVSADSLLGKTPSEIWYINANNMTAGEFQYRIKMTMESGQQQMFELHSPDERVHLVRVIPEFDNNKKVISAISISSDISEISQYRQRIEHMAYHDTLTSLPNRSMLNSRIVSAVDSAHRNKHQLAILMIDLDHFKAINDTLGHNVGDQLLTEVAARIVATLRTSDLVARLGGDEFAVLVEDVSGQEDLDSLATKILQVLAAPFYIARKELFVTVSIGIATCPENGEDASDLLKHADSAMYVAKRQGRNNFQYFVPEFTEKMANKLSMQTELMHAIEKKELYLCYQPFVHLDSGETIGVEALLRWRNEALGEVAPDDFIPLAEDLGVIIEIGQWVMIQAFEDAVTFNKGRKKPLMFAVNLSARQFLRHDIFLAVEYCLSISACDPQWITLEITESLLLNDSEQILDTLHKLKELGIKIAIDDFGTGYSSLSYLNKFPIGEVKIDRSFVSDITVDENDAKLVKAVIGMTLSLGKELIAEGVETQEQADLLKEWGCNIGQGYLFGMPLRFEKLLEHFLA